MKTFRQTQITNKQIIYLVYNNNKILINNYKSQIPNQINYKHSSLLPWVHWWLHNWLRYGFLITVFSDLIWSSPPPYHFFFFFFERKDRLTPYHLIAWELSSLSLDFWICNFWNIFPLMLFISQYISKCIDLVVDMGLNFEL